MLRLTTDRHIASRGFSATAELLVELSAWTGQTDRQPCCNRRAAILKERLYDLKHRNAASLLLLTTKSRKKHERRREQTRAAGDQSKRYGNYVRRPV